MSSFRSSFAETVFNQKYRHEGAETWDELAETLVADVCRHYITPSERSALVQAIREMKFIPGGRYLYYAGRPAKYFQNCYMLKAINDDRQDWADLSWKSESCLMVGGGIGIDYSVYRAKGSRLGRTGGVASGPIPKMQMINEIGRHVMQGGSRRSAIYASLSCEHADVQEFIHAKDWHAMGVPGTDLTVWDLKQKDFNWPAPLDMTNISVNYGDRWLSNFDATGDVGDTFHDNVRQALMTGEPGFSFNFGKQANETLRNACTELTSEDDSDVCNIGSINLSRITDVNELRGVTVLATLFLLCGTFTGDVPYEKVAQVRRQNRRIGLGLMGVHEWLIQRGYRYEMVPELQNWLFNWEVASDAAATDYANKFGCSRPKGVRAIAPTGTIGILAGTTTGIEPLFATAYKRRYLKGTRWHYQYVVDSAAEAVIKRYGVEPESIESSLDLAADPERRIMFQAHLQRYVDHSISSTINLPAWGSELNNEDKVDSFAKTLAKYARGLRGFTCYPDGARGGQPLTTVPYREAMKHKGVEHEEHDVCVWTGKGGSCGS